MVAKSASTASLPVIVAVHEEGMRLRRGAAAEQRKNQHEEHAKEHTKERAEERPEGEARNTDEGGRHGG